MQIHPHNLLTRINFTHRGLLRRGSEHPENASGRHEERRPRSFIASGWSCRSRWHPPARLSRPAGRRDQPRAAPRWPHRVAQVHCLRPQRAPDRLRQGPRQWRVDDRGDGVKHLPVPGGCRDRFARLGQQPTQRGQWPAQVSQDRDRPDDGAQRQTAEEGGRLPAGAADAKEYVFPGGDDRAILATSLGRRSVDGHHQFLGTLLRRRRHCS